MELKFGKRYNWRKIQEIYPDRWVVISNIREIEHGWNYSCVLHEILTQEEFLHGDAIDRYKQKGIKFDIRRTTISEEDLRFNRAI